MLGQEILDARLNVLQKISHILTLGGKVSSLEVKGELKSPYAST